MNEGREKGRWEKDKNEERKKGIKKHAKKAKGLMTLGSEEPKVLVSLRIVPLAGIAILSFETQVQLQPIKRTDARITLADG